MGKLGAGGILLVSAIVLAGCATSSDLAEEGYVGGGSSGGSGGGQSGGTGGSSGGAAGAGASGGAPSGGFGGGGTGGLAGSGGSGGLPPGCADPMDDCDGTPGCELDHSASANSCASAQKLGSHCGDVACNVLSCSPTNWSAFKSAQGNTSKWFVAHSDECSNCCADVEARIHLDVPPGINYDLYLWSSCGAMIDASTQPAGQSEALTTFTGDDCFGSDDSFDYTIEVRYVSGSSCDSWTLTVDGSDC
ncbi:MAG: hypothetical protein KC776_28595 [Myxococcales bacterium]|nr:hypothetical protein [Myxococcales bacterium]